MKRTRKPRIYLRSSLRYAMLSLLAYISMLSMVGHAPSTCVYFNALYGRPCSLYLCIFQCSLWYAMLIPCGESTVVSIVSCQCAYCCPEPVHRKQIDNIHFSVMALCHVQRCELSYNVLGMTQNCIPPSEIIIPNRECVIRLGISEGANVMFKQASHTIR